MASANSDEETGVVLRDYIGSEQGINKLVEVRVQDVVYILDELELMNKTSGFFESAMDGWPYGSHFPNGDAIETPLFLMVKESCGDLLDEANEVIWDMYAETSESECVIVTVAETTHGNFCDFPTLFGVLKYAGFFGSKEPEALNELHREKTIVFLDKYLKN